MTEHRLFLLETGLRHSHRRKVKDETLQMTERKRQLIAHETDLHHSQRMKVKDGTLNNSCFCFEDMSSEDIPELEDKPLAVALLLQSVAIRNTCTHPRS